MKINVGDHICDIRETTGEVHSLPHPSNRYLLSGGSLPGSGIFFFNWVFPGKHYGCIRNVHLAFAVYDLE